MAAAAQERNHPTPRQITIAGAVPGRGPPTWSLGGVDGVRHKLGQPVIVETSWGHRHHRHALSG